MVAKSSLTEEMVLSIKIRADRRNRVHLNTVLSLLCLKRSLHLKAKYENEHLPMNPKMDGGKLEARPHPGPLPQEREKRSQLHPGVTPPAARGHRQGQCQDAPAAILVYAGRAAQADLRRGVETAGFPFRLKWEFSQTRHVCDLAEPREPGNSAETLKSNAGLHWIHAKLQQTFPHYVRQYTKRQYPKMGVSLRQERADWRSHPKQRPLRMTIGRILILKRSNGASKAAAVDYILIGTCHSADSHTLALKQASREPDRPRNCFSIFFDLIRI